MEALAEWLIACALFIEGARRTGKTTIAREEVKHLIADGRFDYLETGSLASIKKSTEKIVIPLENPRAHAMRTT